MSLQYNLRNWIKDRNTPLAKFLYDMAMKIRYFTLPPIPFLHSAIYYLTVGVRNIWSNFLRIFWYTPIFQSRLENPVARLFLYGGVPLIMGGVKIRIGENCRIGGGNLSISGRSYGEKEPELTVGDNCDLGWGSVFMVGRRIVIGDNVRIAANAFFAGYCGHPVDAAARARGEGDREEQIGDIILEDDVWLGTGVTVLRGVTIGRGTIVGASSVVTKSLPPFVLAAGNPARVIRSLDEDALPAGKTATG
jgi:acetyltransferase-like isoleucine patch superfamily enzyme